MESSGCSKELVYFLISKTMSFSENKSAVLGIILGWSLDADDIIFVYYECERQVWWQDWACGYRSQRQYQSTSQQKSFARFWQLNLWANGVLMDECSLVWMALEADEKILCTHWLWGELTCYSIRLVILRSQDQTLQLAEFFHKFIKCLRVLKYQFEAELRVCLAIEMPLFWRKSITCILCI